MPSDVHEFSASDVILETLALRIHNQDRFIAKLLAERDRMQKASVENMLGALRKREAVLLFVGENAIAFTEQIAQKYGKDIGLAVANSLFVLDNAPVSPDVREAFRKATNHGMNKW